MVQAIVWNVAAILFKPQPWWRHQMETFSALLAICAGNSPVPGELPAQKPVTRSSDVVFDLCLNKPLWRHSNVGDCFAGWNHVRMQSFIRFVRVYRPLWNLGRQAPSIVLRPPKTKDPVVDHPHYIDVIMTWAASQITSLAVVYSIVYSDKDERKHQSAASLAFVRGIHRDRWIPRTKGQ